MIYGGVGFQPQVKSLRAGASIVVATPGRLLDHVAQRTIDLSGVEVLILDEADRMLDMGFIRDIRRVLALLPARRQNLLFSATFSDEIRELATGLLDRPATVDVTPRNTPAELIDQLVIPVDRERKRELLAHLVRSGRVEQALVFTRTKHGANRLAEQLERDGIAAAAIHGNKSQGQRVRALDDFKRRRVNILVATDIAARGIDIEALPHVVNYELPMVASDYVHRIGRTGRAGVGGQAISLVCVDEAELLREIQRLLGRTVASEVIPGFEPNRAVRAEPIRLRSMEGAARAGGNGRHHRGGGRPAATGHGRPMPSGRRDRGHGAAPSIGARPSNGARPSIGARPSNGARPSIGARPSNGARPPVNGARPPVNGGSRGMTVMPGERLRRAGA